MKKPLSLNIKDLEKARTSSKDKTENKSKEQIASHISGGMSGGFSATGRSEGDLYDPSLPAAKNHENFKNHIAGLIKNNNFSDALFTSRKIVEIFRNHANLARKSGNVAVARSYENKTNQWSDFAEKLQAKIGQVKDEKAQAISSGSARQPNEQELHDKADMYHDLINGSKNVKESIDNAHSAAQYFINKFSSATDNLTEKRESSLSPEHRNIAKNYAKYFLDMAEKVAPEQGADEELWQQNPFNPDHPLHQQRMAWEKLSPSEKKKQPMPVHPREHALDYPVGMEISRPDTSATKTSPRKLDSSVIQLYSKLLTGKDDVLLHPEEIQQKIDDLMINNPDLAKRAHLNSLLTGNNTDFEENHFEQTNQSRAEQGLPPLERHEHLPELKAIRFILNNPIANPEERSKKGSLGDNDEFSIDQIREKHPLASDISNAQLLQHFSANDLRLASLISDADLAHQHRSLSVKNAQRTAQGQPPLEYPKKGFNVLQAAADIAFANSRPGSPITKEEPDFMKPGKRRQDPKLQLEYQKFREKIATGNYYNPIQPFEPAPDTPEVRSDLEQGSREYFDPKNNPRRAAAATAADIHRRISATKTGGQHTVVGDKIPSSAPVEPRTPSVTELPLRTVEKPTVMPVRTQRAPEGQFTEQIPTISSTENIPDKDPEFFDTRQVAAQITKKTSAKKPKKTTPPQTEKSMQKSAEQAKNPSFLEKRREGATAEPPKEEEVVGNYSEHMKEQKTVNDKPFKQQGFGSVTKLKAMVAKLKNK